MTRTKNHQLISKRNSSHFVRTVLEAMDSSRSVRFLLFERTVASEARDHLENYPVSYILAR